jgi:hypothetical protein
MKLKTTTLLFLALLCGTLPALAAPAGSPCKVCDVAAGLCEDTSAPEGCVPSEKLVSCTEAQQAECRGPDSPEVKNPEAEKCKVWDLFDEVDVGLNPATASLQPYTPFKNCGTYAEAFHYACLRHRFECRSVHYNCDGAGHAVNFIKLKNGWQAIDITGGHSLAQYFVGDPIADPTEIPTDLLCRLVGKPKGCKCNIWENSAQPVMPTTSPYRCSRGILEQVAAGKGGLYRPWSELVSTCRACCQESSEYYFSLTWMPGLVPTIEKWLQECQGSCNSLLPPAKGSGPRPPLSVDSGALYFQAVCKGEASKVKDAEKCGKCGECCNNGAGSPPKYAPERKNSCMVRCNAEWDCKLPVG